MSIELSADGPEWLVLPDRFPWGGIPTREAWIDEAIEYLRDRWGGNLDAEREPMVRGGLEHGLDQVDESDSIALQFWPVIGLANAVVHITAFRSEDPASEIDDIVRAVRESGPSLVAETRARHLGAGVDVRWVEPLETPDATTDESGETPETVAMLAGMLRVFPSVAGAVAVRVDPTLPQLLALLDEPLTTVLDTAVVRADDGEWPAAQIDDATFAEAGETWGEPSSPARA